MESFFIKPFDAFKRVRDERFAFFCEESIANHFINRLFEPHEICHIREVTFKRNDLLGLIVKKFLPLRERFFINFLWMTEVGIANKINRYWNGLKPTCHSTGHFEVVKLEYVLPAFGLLIIAYVTSTIILFIEIVSSKFIKVKKKKFARKWNRILSLEI